MTRFGLLFVALVVFLDQLSKWWILTDVMNPPRMIPLTSFFNIVLVWNRGASFGILNMPAAWVPWLLSGIAVVIVSVLFVWLRRVQQRWLAAGIGMIIGGAIGNVIDRLRFGAVIDFLDVHAGQYHWPAFNIADSAICVGVVILIIDALIARPDGHKLLQNNDEER